MDTLNFSLGVLVFLVALALVFDFMNGFHDAANAIATIVSTRVMRPQHAVLLAAFFNFIAILVFQLKVATTVGAIAWNVITWYYGIPSSSSHALIGGLVGAAVAKSGFDSLIPSGLIKTISFILVSPMLGMFLGSLMMLLVAWTCRRVAPHTMDTWFRRLQLVSASLYSLGHGGNDAQKTMGIIWMLLIASGMLHSGDALPSWVVISCYAAIGAGTMFGGWRIVKTMGQKITHLKPVGGFCAETGGAMTLFLATALGIPVSTTHTITGAIVGVGSTRKKSSVRWGIASSIVWAWVLTIPCSAVIAAVFWYIGRFIL